jgi:hypothetical protein
MSNFAMCGTGSDSKAVDTLVTVSMGSDVSRDSGAGH